jgi:tryptophan synthase alpha chain
MTRLHTAFASGRPAFMPYFPLGYPTIEASVAVLEALARGGADLIEVGLPFSDPLADGPVIQRATQIALRNGMTVERGLQAIAELRSRGASIPLVLMGYYNPLLAYGLARLAERSAQAGVDGFIVPDLPPEEAGEFEAALAETPAAETLPIIRMLAPTTPAERAGRVARDAQGFLYLVSLTGVTGARDQLPEGLQDFVVRMRSATSLPVCVGFGIATPEQARTVSQIADGVIVGSACVRAVGNAPDPAQAAEQFARSFTEALA